MSNFLKKNENYNIKMYKKQIQLNNYYYSVINLQDFIKIPVFIEQRELNKCHVNEIVKYQEQYFIKNKHFELFSCPIIAINNNEIFDTIDNTKSKCVLFDGQHRQQSFKILYEQSKLNLEDQLIEIKIFKCNSNDEIYELFKSFNNQKSLSLIELSKKSNKNINKILNKSIDSFYDYPEKVINPKNFYFGKFYKSYFKQIFYNDNELFEYIKNNEITEKEIFDNLQKVNYQIYLELFNKNYFSNFHNQNSAWKKKFDKFIKETDLNLLVQNDNYFRFIYPKNYIYILEKVKKLLEI